MSSGINFKKDSSYDMMGEQKLEQNLHIIGEKPNHCLNS